MRHYEDIQLRMDFGVSMKCQFYVIGMFDFGTTLLTRYVYIYQLRDMWIHMELELALLGVCMCIEMSKLIEVGLDD